MRLVLGITNYEGFHPTAYTFGLGSVDSYVRQRGHDSHLIAINDDEEMAAYEDLLLALQPRVVGFSAVSSQAHHARRALAAAKRLLPGVITVMGGFHPTLFPETLLESPEVDVYFRGESEVPFGQFLDCLERGEDWREVPNLVFRDETGLTSNPLAPLVQDLATLPWPTKGRLFEENICNRGMGYFLFSRGCPFECAYCCNQSLADLYDMPRNTPRFRDVPGCLAEIQDAHARHPFESVWIVDDTFGLNAPWLQEFLETYPKTVGLPFMCNQRVDQFSEERARALKKAGCFMVLFGVESGDESIRRRLLQKRTTNEQIEAAFDICKRVGLKTIGSFIIGLPDESIAQIESTLELNQRITPDLSFVNIFYPYRGTPLGDHCFREGLVDTDKLATFSNERRETVLRFPEAHQAALHALYAEWYDRLGQPSPIRGA